ncbi:MAG: hypothetical protein Q7U76_13010 [Nitrospirota bacterium]|nr:hypothetical protein [Nitrospirota bacterium]
MSMKHAKFLVVAVVVVAIAVCLGLVGLAIRSVYVFFQGGF